MNNDPGPSIRCFSGLSEDGMVRNRCGKSGGATAMAGSVLMISRAMPLSCSLVSTRSHEQHTGMLWVVKSASFTKAA